VRHLKDSTCRQGDCIRPVRSWCNGFASNFDPEKNCWPEGEVLDEILKIKMIPQLEEPPGTASSKFFLGKKAQRHQMKVSVNFSKEQFTKANSVTFGQLLR
jgi:hypothetical protein